jgi:uncharacterized membrane protein YgcG
MLAISSVGSTSAGGQRRSAKGKGIDADASRRTREEKAIQLRKDRRFDRANVERRKFKVMESTESDTPEKGQRLVTNYSLLPQRAAALDSPVPQEQVEAATFFRRILAADKQPPLDVVIDTGTVVPALVRFLSRTDTPALQLEAAWSLTNIACGEARHVSYLLHVGALSALLQAVTVGHAALRDQALWAVCNMTATVEACVHLLRQQDALLVVLQQIGVHCILSTVEPAGRRDEQTRGDSQSKLMGASFNSNGSTGSTGSTSHSSVMIGEAGSSNGSPSLGGLGLEGVGSMDSMGSMGSMDSELLSIKQVPVGEVPSLSTMRHVAFICGNVARLKTQLPLVVYRIVLFAMSELAYSPDEEIVLEISSCMTVIIEKPHLVGVMLECGLASRMKDCLEASGTSARLYEMALLVLCALLRSQHHLHRAVVLALGSGSGSSGSGGRAPSSSGYKNSGNSKNSIGGVGGGGGRHVLHHLIAHMSKGVTVTEEAGKKIEPLDNLTKIELCKTLTAVLAFPKYADMCIELGAVEGLGIFIAQDVSEVTEEAGSALCTLLLCPGLLQRQRDPALISKIASQLALLLRAHSAELLHAAIVAFGMVLKLARVGHVWFATADIQEQLDLLLLHAHPAVASVAEGLERILAQYRGAFDDDCMD